MSSFLERLRQKPEAIRTRYLFFSVGVSFFFIAIIWIFSLKTSLGSITQDETVGTFAESIQNITKGAPASLDDLIKTGKTLTEQGNTTNKESTSPENRIENLLPNSEMNPEESKP